MTSHVARLYALVVGILGFFAAWVAVVTHPWAPAPAVAAKDPRLAALAVRQQLIHRESLRVQKIVNARWAAYRNALARRNAAAATQMASVAAAATSAPSVRVVTLPPLTVTRMS